MNNIRIHKDGIDISVSVVLFKENGVYIAYCPSLDIAGYDTTEVAAKEDFTFMLKDWVKEQTLNKTLEKDLAMHGWKMEGDESKEPNIAEIIKLNSNAVSVFGRPEYRKTNVRARVVC